MIYKDKILTPFVSEEEETPKPPEEEETPKPPEEEKEEEEKIE